MGLQVAIRGAKNCIASTRQPPACMSVCYVRALQAGHVNHLEKVVKVLTVECDTKNTLLVLAMFPLVWQSRSDVTRQLSRMLNGRM